MIIKATACSEAAYEHEYPSTLSVYCHQHLAVRLVLRFWTPHAWAHLVRVSIALSPGQLYRTPSASSGAQVLK